MNRHINALLIFLLIFFGCAGHSGLTIEALRNSKYKAEDFEHVIQLKDGRYEGTPYVEGGTSRPIFILSDIYAFGDLNGDGAEDAAVVLVGSFGGSGTFYHLRAVINQKGKPLDFAGVLLGDRVGLESIKVSKDVITVGMVERRQDEPMTDPGSPIIVTYSLQDNQLIEEARNSY